MLLGQKLAMTATQNSSKIAFRYLAKGQIYREAYSYINRYSYFLQNEIQHNKRVMVYMSNCPHMAYTFFALANTKNVAVFVDPNTPEMKVVDKIRDLGIEAIIVSDDYVSRVKEMFRQNHIQIPVIQCESRRWGEYDTTYRLPVSVSAGDNDTVALFETAGTTGKPKLVPYTHAMIQQAVLVLRTSYRTSGMDNFFTYQANLANPFYFIHGLLYPFMNGCTVTITDITNPDELGKELMEAKVTRVVMRGQVVEDWLKSFTAINIRLPLIRSITPEYAILNPALAEQAKTDFNAKILNVYGSVESCWAVGATQFEEPEPIHTVGQFFPGIKVRIVDENGDDIPANKPQRGQLLISGAGVAQSYFNNKEATKLNMRGAWFFTSDYVEQDKKGVVKFLDRKENICKYQNEIIVPREEEAIICKCPGVDRAALIAVKDQLGKLQLTAVILKQVGVELSTQDLQTYCDANIKEHHRPRNFAFVAEMPMDAHGDVNRFRLRFELSP